MPDSLLSIAEEMYGEIATRVMQEATRSGKPMTEDMELDINRWYAIIKKEDPMWLDPLDECVPMEDK